MSETRSIGISLAVVAALVTAAGPLSVQAHVSSGINCSQCHTTARNAYSLQDFQATVDKGQGPRPVFTVKAGQTVPIGVNVSNGASQYGVNFNVQNKAGVTNAVSMFAFTPDAAWTAQKSSTYFTRGPLSANAKSTYQLKVNAGTPADLYRAEVVVAGKGNNMWHHRTNFYIQVEADVVNQVPSITPVGDQSVDELTALRFDVLASDPDASQTLTYALGAGAPSAATVGSTSGAFSWTPAEADGPGVYPISVIVSDNGSPVKKATNSFQVTVREVNVAPTIEAISAKSVQVGNMLNFTAAGHDTDVPAQTLTYSLGAGAPAAASVNGTTGQFAWTPQAADAPNTYAIDVIVTDSGSPAKSATATVQVAVTPAVVVLPPQVVTPVVTGGTFACSVATVAGATYYLEFKSALVDGPWSAPVAQVVGDGTLKPLKDPAPAGTAGYYRIRVE